MTTNRLAGLAMCRIDRRGFLAGAAAVGAGTLAGLGPAAAATEAIWVGWQGYDEPLKLGSFLADNDISLATTYINTNEEIITRLQAGGAGQVDLITIYYGHIPILIAADLLEPIDESRLPAIADVFPEFLKVEVLRKDGKLYAVPFTWGTLSMVYDPAAAPKPVSWKDALKDEYKGKVALVDDATGLLATWSPIAVGTKTPTRLTMDELKQHGRLPHRHQEESRPHPVVELRRGDRPLRPRRGGHLGDRLGRHDRLRRRKGEGPRLRHPGGGRDGVHGHARHPEGRAASRRRLQAPGAVDLGSRPEAYCRHADAGGHHQGGACRWSARRTARSTSTTT